DFDVRHSFSAALTYNIPAPDWGSAAKALLRNWSFNTVFFARTAPPFTFNANPQKSTTLFRVTYTRRPDPVPGVPQFIYDDAAPGGKRVNPAAFKFPLASEAQGTVGRNTLNGFGAWQADIGLHRQFNLTERLNLQF